MAQIRTNHQRLPNKRRSNHTGRVKLRGRKTSYHAATNNHSSSGQSSNIGLIISEIKVPDYYVTVRSDTEQVLGVVGNEYEVVQRVNAFSFFGAAVESRKGSLYETVGALGKWERIFITTKPPDYIIVGKNGLIEQYLFLTTSHDGSGNTTIAFIYTCQIVCQNTLNVSVTELLSAFIKKVLIKNKI